jgi:hypothetical protein
MQTRGFPVRTGALSPLSYGAILVGAGGFEPPCAGLEDRNLNPLGHAPELQQKRYLSHADSSPIISRCFAWIPIGAGFRMSGIPASAGVLSAFRLLHT